MSNYEARMTAKNMEITEYNKEALSRLMVFGTMLGKELNTHEVYNTVSIINDWNIEGLEDVRTVQDLQTLKSENWAEKQDLSDVIALLVDILSETDYFDIQDKMKKTLSQYSEDFMRDVPNSSGTEAAKIKFSNTDFACQFYGSDGNQGTREVSQSEKLANLMYLSNQLSHGFLESFDENKPGITTFQIKHIIYELRKIKRWSTRELIEQKRQGNPIDISVAEDKNITSGSRHNSEISFALPNYLEPFMVHFDSSILTDEELNLCDGTERYWSKGIRPTFPQYLTQEKMNLLERVYKNSYSDERSLNSVRGKRLQWLFDTKRILELMERKKLKNSANKQQDISFKKAKKDDKYLQMQHENSELFETIQKNIGVNLPAYFKDGFLKRTSYSLSQYMSTIYGPVRQALTSNGVEQKDIDTEFAKLFIYIKMTKPLSTKMQRPKAERIELALQSIAEYKPVYDFIIEHLDSEKTYADLKSKTRKYANSIALENENQEQLDEVNTQEAQEEIEQKPTVEESPENASAEVIVPEEVTIPAETAQALIDEITELNTEMGDLSKTIQDASTKLSLLQSKLAEVQAKLHNALNQDFEDTNR